LEQNLTQAELAQKAGTRQSNISRLEGGEYNPSLKFLKKIASSLGKKLHISFK
jgi:transcriptional regulator with XRE-family HTH domain